MIGAGPSESTAQPPFRHSLRTRRFDPKATFKIGPMTRGKGEKAVFGSRLRQERVGGHAPPSAKDLRDLIVSNPIRRPGAGIGSPATGKKADCPRGVRARRGREAPRPLRRSDYKQECAPSALWRREIANMLFPAVSPPIGGIFSNKESYPSGGCRRSGAGPRGLLGWTPDRSMRRAVISLVLFLIVWQIGSTSRAWLGTPLPVIGAVPSPDSVVRAWAQLIADPGYWQSWIWSALHVSLGFAAAALVGIPFGLALAANATFRGVAFPVFELLRPIPPLAWVPASIIFWPTQELSIAFVIFLGGFYTIVINVVGGAEAIDARLIQSARSMGATRGTIFRASFCLASCRRLGSACRSQSASPGRSSSQRK